MRALAFLRAAARAPIPPPSPFVHLPRRQSVFGHLLERPDDNWRLRIKPPQADDLFQRPKGRVIQTRALHEFGMLFPVAAFEDHFAPSHGSQFTTRFRRLFA